MGYKHRYKHGVQTWGTNNGHEQEYKQGYKHGVLTWGTNMGSNRGANMGYKLEYEQGYEQGYKHGYEQGYGQGYKHKVTLSKVFYFNPPEHFADRPTDMSNF